MNYGPALALLLIVSTSQSASATYPARIEISAQQIPSLSEIRKELKNAYAERPDLYTDERFPLIQKELEDAVRNVAKLGSGMLECERLRSMKTQCQSAQLRVLKQISHHPRRGTTVSFDLEIKRSNIVAYADEEISSRSGGSVEWIYCTPERPDVYACAVVMVSTVKLAL